MSVLNPQGIYADALRGEPGAYAALAVSIAHNIALGHTDYSEGMAQVCLWWRLAETYDVPEYRDGLVTALLGMSADCAASGLENRAVWYGSEAIRYLELAAERGCEASAARLAKAATSVSSDALQLAKRGLSDTRAEHEEYRAIIRAASKGSAPALHRMLDEVLTATEDREGYGQEVPDLEAIVLLEAIARLGAQTGDAELQRRFAGILLLRDTVDRERGDRRMRRDIEAQVVLGRLAARGDADAEALLREAVSSLPPVTALIAACEEPHVLTALETKGIA